MPRKYPDETKQKPTACSKSTTPFRFRLILCPLCPKKFFFVRKWTKTDKVQTET